MDSKTLEELKSSLEKERDIVVAELKAIAKPDPHMKGNWDANYPQFGTAESGSHSSQDEETDEVEEYEVRLETEHSLESRLLALSHALERIQKGIYGKCLKCNKEIPLERLRANPAAEFDIEHETKN